MADTRLSGELGFEAETRWKSLRRVGWGLVGVAGVFAAGVAGYLAAGWDLGDAVYMVMITMSTVGFTEVRPTNSTWLRLHTMTLIALGYVAVGYTLACLVAFIAEEEFRRFLGTQRVKRQIDHLEAHIIVVGLGRMGLRVCKELDAAGEPFVVVDRSIEKLAEIERLHWLFVQGDATEEHVLEEAGIRRARALVAAIPDDAVNVFITLTAREMATNVHIIARAETSTTEQKLKRAGASQVVLPASIGAQRVVAMLTNPGAVTFTELVTNKTTLKIELEEVEVKPEGELFGKTLRELDIGHRTGVVIIAIKRAEGQVIFPPSGTESLANGDKIVLLGRGPNLEQFRAAFQL
jgi:Trk K+ transport system NAD-binding subunit